MRRRIYPGDHPDVAMGLNYVAFVLNAQGNAAEALPKYQEALAMWQRIYKSDHPDLASLFDNVASSYHALNQPLDALTNLESALAMRQRLYPGDHPDVALSLGKVGFYLDATGRPDEAIQKYKEANEMTQRLANAQPSNFSIKMDLAGLRKKIGDSWAKKGDSENESKSYREAMEVVDSILAANATSSAAAKLRQILRLRLGLDRAEVVVTRIVPNSQAEKLGVRTGDFMLTYAGQRITSADHLGALSALAAGPGIELEARREADPLKFTVKGGALGILAAERNISASTAK
jgi:tetratricopeptide (TPR) repeat protein